MARPSNRALIAAAAIGAALVLSLPVSNYFIGREKIEIQSQSAGFADVSKILQNSCADCHSPELTVYPLYAQLPIAHDLIAKDINDAQGSFPLTKAQLSGAQPLSTIELAKIASVIADNSMPPGKYLSMHWNAKLSKAQKKSVLAYIQERQDENGAVPTPIPLKNPFSVDPKKAKLGRRLYNDKRLSGDNTVSCASCHLLSRGGADGAVVSTGIRGQLGPINSPTVFNSAFNFRQFWDGRAADLAEQAVGPITNPVEMGSNFTQILSKIGSDAEYGAMSRAAYGGPLDAHKIKDAISAYEKTLITPNCAFDKYLRGDNSALTDIEKRGYQLFTEKNCATCHTGVGMGGLSYEKMGSAKDYFAYREGRLGKPATLADNGRFNVTNDPNDMHKFKVPLLRNIELTAPYFHDGSAKTLTEAVNVMAEYESGTKLTEAETEAIVAFLKTLTGEFEGKKLQ